MKRVGRQFWFLEAFDWILLACALALVAIGVAFIYSASVNSDGVLVTREYIKQIVWASLGLVLLAVAVLYDYRLSERYAPAIYAAFLLILAYTGVWGNEVNGARSWLGIGGFGVQPSEFAKIALIIALARYLAASGAEKPFVRFLKAMAITMLPTGLVLIQPDMGTASVYIPIFLVMCVMAGIPLKYIFFTLGAGLLTMVLAVLPAWNSMTGRNIPFIAALENTRLRILLILAALLVALIGMVVRRYFHGKKYFYWISFAFLIVTASLALSYAAGRVLRDYQIQRLIIFLDPASDPRGAGWNISQSKIAIGAGGIYGRGFLRGTQSQLRFLPQRSTDFIFSILSEEFGFVGGLVVFGLYAVIFIHMLRTMRNSEGYGCYVASGILGMFAFHFFINIGMVMGIMPITGIPLLFLSYGGSSLWTAMICIGMLMSIRYHKYGLAE